MDDHAYFRAIEDHFIRLRGAPLLLSPADWQVAREWHREGIPLELVKSTLDSVFERRAERGSDTPVQSLRYCASAVRAAWIHSSKMEQAGRREAVEPLDLRGRLRALADALPERLEGVAAIRESIERLAAAGGGAEAVEASLAALDAELLAAGLESLSAEQRAEVERRIERGLETLGGRLTVAETAVARRRLRDQALRRELRLPLLSLFGAG